MTLHALNAPTPATVVAGRTERASDLPRFVRDQTGAEFFRLVAAHLAAVSGCEAVWICITDTDPANDNLQLLASFDRDKDEAPPNVARAGTPLVEVLRYGNFSLDSGVKHRYPASVMAQLGFDGFSGTALHDEHGQILGIIALLNRAGQTGRLEAEYLLHDCTPRLRSELVQERTLREQGERLRFLEGLVEAIPNPLFFKDHQFRYRWCNSAMEKLVGLPRHELIGKSVFDVQPLETAQINQRTNLAALTKGLQIYENTFVIADGSCREVIYSKTPLHGDDGSIRGVVCTIQDISAQRQAEREVFRLSNYDDLTGLPNRINFLRLLADTEQEWCGATLTVLDLDNFNILNDTLGHDFCSLLLTEVSRRLLVLIGSQGSLARIGKDRFAIVWYGLRNPDQDEQLGAQLVSILARPIEIGGQMVHATASVGISSKNDEPQGADQLLHCAELALHQARQLGRGTFMRYHGGLSNEARARLRLENDLRHALTNHEFSLVYQPQFELASERMTGVEALLRWQHPQEGAIAPDCFIPLAEATGLIVEIGLWVLETACQQQLAWQQAGLEPVRMAVNVSGLQLKHPDFIDQVAAILQRTGMDARWLELELTETTVMENSEQNIRILDQLKQLGLRLSIDDFGTGYSSLAYLKRFPIDSLKIDRAFMLDLPTNDEDVSIIEAILLMARGLGLEVIAEGVETREQIAFLQKKGGTLAQGYYFSKPIDAASLAGLIRSGHLLPAHG